MKYGSVIRELAFQGANWRFYDETFRRIRQTQGGLGTRFMLSYGLGLIIFEPNLVPRQDKVNKMGNPYLRGFDRNFVGESYSLGVHTITSISGVGTATQFPDVNQAPNSPLGIRGQNQFHLPSMALPTKVLPSEALPTPIKAKSLAAYLTGYEENLRKHYLAFYMVFISSNFVHTI